jgi:hypothetical protein
MPNPTIFHRCRSLITAGVTFGAALFVGFRLAPEPPAAAEQGRNASASLTASSSYDPVSAPWLDLLRTEGRLSAKVHAALQNIPEAAIPDALRLLPHVALAAEDEAGAAAVLWHRLTRLHPDTAFDLLCRMKYRFQLDPAIVSVFFATVAHEGWARTQEFLLRPETHGKELEAITAALPVLRALDPTALNDALAFERSLHSGPSDSETPGSVEPETDPTKQIEALAQKDPQAALDLFLTLPEHARTARSLMYLLSRWPDTGTDQLLELHQALVKPELLTLVEQVRTLRLAKTDLPAAIAWLDTLPEDRRQTAAESIREQLILGDPAAAQRLVRPREEWGSIVNAIFREPDRTIERFIRQQPQAARTWAESFPEGPLQTSARSAYLSVLALQDPVQARAFAMADSDKNRAAQVLGKISLTPSATHDFLAPLPAELRQAAALAYLEHFPAWDNRGAKDHAREYAPMLDLVQVPAEMTPQTQTTLSAAIWQTATAAAETKPVETIAWLQHQPEAIAGPLFSRAFETWVNYADQAALQWLSAQDNFPWKDRALAAAAKSLAECDPDRAAQLRAQISTNTK